MYRMIVTPGGKFHRNGKLWVNFKIEFKLTFDLYTCMAALN